MDGIGDRSSGDGNERDGGKEDSGVWVIVGSDGNNMNGVRNELDAWVAGAGSSGMGVGGTVGCDVEKKKEKDVEECRGYWDTGVEWWNEYVE